MHNTQVVVGQVESQESNGFIEIVLVSCTKQEHNIITAISQNLTNYCNQIIKVLVPGSTLSMNTSI